MEEETHRWDKFKFGFSKNQRNQRGLENGGRNPRNWKGGKIKSWITFLSLTHLVGSIYALLFLKGATKFLRVKKKYGPI